MIDRHVSETFTVGVRRRMSDGGEVNICLVKAGDGPVLLQLVAAHMASATAQLDLKAAAKLRDDLAELLRQAGRE